MLLDELRAVIDQLVEVEPSCLADADTLVELHRQLDRLDAVTTLATGCFDTAGEWKADGARTAAAWLTVRGHHPRSAAKRRVGLARALRHLPICQTAWLDGDISSAQVRALARARRPSTEERLAADEAMLVGHARNLNYQQFAKIVEYWAQHADPDGADREADEQHRDRRFHLSQSLDGRWFGDLVLDPIAGTIVADEVGRIETELFNAEWDEARHRLGHDPTASDLARTPAQRRADALTEMAIRSRSAAAGARRPEPLFTILVNWETFRGRICELANGTTVAPGAVVPWLPIAWVERIVFDSPSRVIDVGVTQRLFTGATRRAIEVRDQQCFHEFCDAPADECEGDHKIPYSAQGPTTQDNGRLACGFHNRARQARPPPQQGP